MLQENPSKGGNPTDENLNLRKLGSILESPIDLVFGISIVKPEILGRHWIKSCFNCSNDWFKKVFYF